ncbi:MAG: endo-1,4-beta-xylanase [Cytophagales bacterium]
MKNIILKFSLLGLFACSQFVYAQLGKCKGKYLGNIVANSVQTPYNGLWNQMTMENASKWQSVNGTKGVYNFNGSDIGFNWAKNNNGLFKYHCLMWGAQTGGWVANATSADIQTEIPKYFKAVADHYNAMGGLKLIDVLNEPINTAVASNLKNALTAGYKAEAANASDINNQYGWAIWTFQLARKYFPNATLLINEYNVEMNWNNCRAGYISMINAIKNAPNITDGKKNLIDGVGLQSHGVDNLTAANFKACLDEIWTKTGLPIHITEFDQAGTESKQQQVYSTLIPIAWEHPHVAGITLWGYIEGQTWITGSGILNSNLTDRSAMTWLRSYFAGRPSLSCCPAPAPFAACDGSNVPTISFTSPANNASFIQGTSITLTASASDADGTIASVKFYDGSTLLSTDNTSPYSFTWTNASTGSHTIKGVATDNSGNTTEVSIIIKVNVAQAPYGGTAWGIPGVIQLENYDVGGNKVAYYDSTAGSEVSPVVNFRTDEDVDIETCTDVGGGYNIGYATKGEWLEYTVKVNNTATYDLDLRVACNGTGRTLSVSMDGVNIASNVAIPNTGGWQTWQTVTVSGIPLTAGQKVMRLTVGNTDYVNLNYVEYKVVTDVEDYSTTEKVQVGPNPFGNNGFNILHKGTFNYTVFDINGSKIESDLAENQILLGENYKQGTYILKIVSDNIVHTHKLIKNK